jgi:predicted transposase YdaD
VADVWSVARSELPNPHDALFHAAFSRQENAAAEFRAVLPPALIARIDWSTLHLTDGHYVDEDLASRQSDLLYTAQLGGTAVGLYVLFEHQSTADPLMPFRLLRYMVRIWDRWLADRGGQEHPKTLPAIVPVVLAHAEGGWTAPVSMQELYGIAPDILHAVQEHLPRFEMVLDDLSCQSDEELRAKAHAGLGLLALFLMRWSRNGTELLERLAEWSDVWRAVWEAPDGRQALGMALRYAALAAEPATLQDLARKLEPILGTGVREVAMTEGERLIEQGWRKGLVEGEARGRAAERIKAQAEALLSVLAARDLAVSSDLRTRIEACTDPATLARWIERAATAESASEAISEA